MIVEPVIQTIPQSSAEREALRWDIEANDMAYKLIVSDDFRYSLIILSANNSVNDKQLMELIEQKLAAFPGNETLPLTASPS